MKKLITIFLAILLVFMSPNKIKAEEIKYPDIAAKAAIVVDQNSGRILFQKNIHEKLPMASTTKIMTLLLALEKGNLSDIVTVSKRASSVGGSSIWLSPGEKIDLESLLYGLMLNSGNDAATAIAEHIGGNVDNFVKMMNEKANEIGAKDTNFVTPSGLDIGIDNHYTTAYDLALITKYAFKYKKFEQIVSTKEKTIPWEGHNWNRYLRNKNKMLWIYEGADGVKTGFTNKAGRCLVSSATRDGHRLISVVLNSGPMWDDSKKILDYAFLKYKPFKVIDKETVIKDIPIKNGKFNILPVVPKDDYIVPVSEEEKSKINVDVKLPQKIAAPITIDQKIGYAIIMIDNEMIGKIDLVANKTVEKKDFQFNFDKLIENWLKIFDNSTP